MKGTRNADKITTTYTVVNANSRAENWTHSQSEREREREIVDGCSRKKDSFVLSRKEILF